MRVVGLARAVTDPDHVAGGGVPVARGGVDAGQRFLIAKQQRLMAREEIGLAQARIVVRRDADRPHEVHGFGDAIGKLAVALALRAVLDEAEHPLVDVLEVGVAAHRKRAQKVQRRSRLAVGHRLAFRVRNARFLGEFDAVDDVAAVAWQRNAVLGLDIGRARLGELAGDTADLDHRLLRTEGENDGHLKEGTEEVADVVRAMFGEAFGAVAALQQEAVAFRYIGEMLLQAARFPGEDERRIGCQLCFRGRERCLIRIVRHLLDWLLPPAIRGPVLCHVTSPVLHPAFA